MIFTKYQQSSLNTSSLGKKNDSILDHKAGRVTFLILDRTIDLLSPILHDFYYYPLLYDVLDIKNNVYETNQNYFF